jgi:lysophospholipase L1-like esterase
MNLFRVSRIPCASLLLAACAFIGASGGVLRASQLIANLNAGKSQTVVLYGTSLTAGGAWARPASTVGIGYWLTGLYGDKATIINNADFGRDSSWGVANLKTRVTDLKPDTVIIEFSVNDAVIDRNISTIQSKANLNAMIDGILAANPDAEIILQTMSPVFDVEWTNVGNVTQNYYQRSLRHDPDTYYQVYRDVAAERGLLLVDHYTNWLDRMAKETLLGDSYAGWFDANGSPTTSVVASTPNYYDGLHPQNPLSLAVTLPFLQDQLLHGTPVPEPAAAAAVLGLTVAGLILYRHRRPVRENRRAA